ncbi:hypothetical protein [Phocaeicola vulgatus]|uniref:hypothetical protein n=1 Tax=Phocaeicola vulgatus TaxID=821 RepID=UPI001E2D936D|nr:hypothetical protein [Phocaeicola vulgatus]BDC06844.1 hypothetical protein GAIMETA21S03_27270 [Phocaeicola vulgatus]
MAADRRSGTKEKRNGKYNVWQVKAKIEKAQAQESEAAELCRTEGAEIPVLFRDRMKQAQLNNGKRMLSRFF